MSDSRSGPQLQGYYSGLGVSTNATDSANDVNIAVGSAAADTSPYALMQLNTALTKRIDANWAVGNNQGGLDTGSVSAAGTYYIWLIQRSDTLVVDALFSLSNTAPTMPTGYDRRRLIGSVVRSSSTNGSPASSITSKPPFISSPQTVVFNTTVTVAHGLGAIPTVLQLFLECITTEQGYNPGERVPVYFHFNGFAETGRGVQIYASTTNIVIVSGVNGVWVMSASSRTQFQITPANWRYVAVARV